MADATKWQDELWSFLAYNDVAICPVYDNCDVRNSAGICFDKYPKNEIDYNIIDGMVTKRHQCDTHRFEVAAREFALVEKLADEFVKDSGVQNPPIPDDIVMGVDREHNIEVRQVPLKNHRGALWNIGGDWVIHLNQNEPHTHQRATLFHEGFHILSHCAANPAFRKQSSEGSFFRESFGDYFARCVQMPREWMTQKWAEVGDIRQMAEIFEVSTAAMRRRLLGLGLIQ